MSSVTYKEAGRRYRRLYWPLIALYVALCIGGPLLLMAVDDPPKWAWAAVAAATGAPMIGVFWLIGRYLNETDEYTRKTQTDALLIGGAATLSFATVWGFLDLYEVLPPLWSFWLLPMFFVVYGLASCLPRLRAASPDRT
jgi:hypothetical protein